MRVLGSCFFYRIADPSGKQFLPGITLQLCFVRRLLHSVLIVLPTDVMVLTNFRFSYSVRAFFSLTHCLLLHVLSLIVLHTLLLSLQPFFLVILGQASFSSF